MARFFPSAIRSILRQSANRPKGLTGNGGRIPLVAPSSYPVKFNYTAAFLSGVTFQDLPFSQASMKFASFCNAALRSSK